MVPYSEHSAIFSLHFKMHWKIAISTWNALLRDDSYHIRSIDINWKLLRQIVFST